MAKKPATLIPGDVLKERIEEYNLHINQVAEEVGLSVSAVRQIISNKAKISLHIAKRFAKYFGDTVEFWIEMQLKYDLAELDKDAELNESLKLIPRAKKAAAKPEPKRGRKPAAGKAEKPVKAAVKAGRGKPGRKPAKDKETAGAKTGAKRGRKPGNAGGGSDS